MTKIEILDLLRVIAEQGLSHQCAMEGYVDRYGCEDCKAATEDKLKELIRQMEAENGGQA